LRQSLRHRFYTRPSPYIVNGLENANDANYFLAFAENAIDLQRQQSG